MNSFDTFDAPSQRFAADRRFDIAIGISAVVTTTALVVLAFVVNDGAAERAQFVVAGMEGAVLTLALAVAGRALRGVARRIVTSWVPAAVPAAA